MPQLTYKTSLTHFLSIEEKQQLLDFMKVQGKYFRTLFNLFYFKNNISTEEKNELHKKYCSSQYLKENGYPFGTKYAHSLFQEAHNKAILHQEGYCFRLQQIEEKLKVLNNKKEKLIEKLKNNKQTQTVGLCNSKENKAIKTIKTSLYWINRKIEKQQSLLKSSSLKSVTFGSKSFQRKLSLKQITKKKWQSLRNNFIYATGRSERKCGNDSIQFDVKNNTLKIELDRSEQHKNYLVLDKIENKYQSRSPTSTSFYKENNLLLEIHKKTQRIVLTKFSEFNLAKCKFELHTTVEKEELPQIIEMKEKITEFSNNLRKSEMDKKEEKEIQKAIKNYANSLYEEKRKENCLGIDFNYQHLDVSSNILNQESNSNLYLHEQTIDYAITSNNRNYNKESLRKAIRAIVLIAKQQNLNIKIEDLNFNKKKAKLFASSDELIKKYNQMLSSLPYALYEKMMEIECYKAGIYLIKVNPKNTSQQALQKNWDRHIGAARMIAQL